MKLRGYGFLCTLADEESAEAASLWSCLQHLEVSTVSILNRIESKTLNKERERDPK